jgi:hypothetical protein
MQSRCWRRKNIVVSLFVLVALAFSSQTALAQDSLRRFEVGLALRFMPTGWFDWAGSDPRAGRDLRAYPALGAAPFVDYRLNRFASIGFMPEFTLNIIPKVEDYPISAMIAPCLRVKLEYPGFGFVVPYVLLAPGYSWVFSYGNLGVGGGDAHGFVLGAHGGARVPLGSRHSVFVEFGYLRGFQSEGGKAYAPSYLVIAAGWQASL